LDVLLYAPAGLALTIVQELPNFVEKGRNGIEGQTATARMIGQFVVQTGVKEISRRIHPPQKSAGEKPPAPKPSRAQTPPSDPAPKVEEYEKRQSAYSSPSTAVVAQAPVDDLAIPAYDTLSASQVVKRLAGLSREELLEVENHERSNRHRATILNRVEQLLAGSPPASTS
jgi:hypothetical protein